MKSTSDDVSKAGLDACGIAAASFSVPPGCSIDVMKDCLHHLQETEGYEVYHLFEREGGGRKPVQHRTWFEAAEQYQATSVGQDRRYEEQKGGKVFAGDSSFAELATENGWVVLTPLTRQAPPRKMQHGRPQGKPPSGRFKSVPPKKAAAPPPPPFGKRLHWKVLPAAKLEDTIFGELKPWNEADPPLNTQHLEQLFLPAHSACAGSSESKMLGVSAKLRSMTSSVMPGIMTPGAPLGGSSRTSKQHICLLDPRRAQNLAIGLRQVMMPMGELCEALRWMHLSHPISVDMLEHVHDNLLPPLLESPELLKYDGEPELLRDVERQLLPLAKLSRPKARVRTMLFSKNMPGLNQELLTRMHALSSACEQVRSSGAFRKVLSTVLRIGNYLNYGVDAPTVGAGIETRGFAIEGLLKLRDFRAANGGDISALHGVVLHLMSVEPQFLKQVQQELCHVLGPGEGTTATGSGIRDLRDSVGTFRSETDLVHCEIDRFRTSYELEGETKGHLGPITVLQRLAEDAAEMAANLEARLMETLTSAWRLLEYFGTQEAQAPRHAWSDASCDAIERFFSTLQEFITSLEECCREILEQPRRLGFEGILASLEKDGNVIAVREHISSVQKCGGWD